MKHAVKAITRYVAEFLVALLILTGWLPVVIVTFAVCDLNCQ